MIDIFAIVLTHGLMLLLAWRLLARADLDREPVADKTGADGAEQTRRA